MPHVDKNHAACHIALIKVSATGLQCFYDPGVSVFLGSQLQQILNVWDRFITEDETDFHIDA